MGIVRTDEWLDDDFQEPVKICEKFMDAFGEKNPEKVYRYLLEYGMYKPNRKSLESFEGMKEMKMWDIVGKIYLTYRRKWKGPSIQLYIFPCVSGDIFTNRGKTFKAGVSFRDKIFLFLSPLEDEKEIEALFVHEYHHTCRIHKQKKSIHDYRLLDSIILEGLAEHAVEECCGKEYLAGWCTYYTREEILREWEHTLEKELNTVKDSRKHDQILFGRNRFKTMIGYATGYEIISIYKEENKLTLEDSLQLPSENFIKKLQHDEQVH